LGEASAIGFEERLQKSVGPFELLAHDRFPYGRRGIAAGYREPAVADMDAFAKGGKWRRRAFDEPREQRTMVGEELQRVVVERGKAVADQRTRSIGQNRGDQIFAADGPVKHRLA